MESKKIELQNWYPLSLLDEIFNIVFYRIVKLNGDVLRQHIRGFNGSREISGWGIAYLVELRTRAGYSAIKEWEIPAIDFFVKPTTLKPASDVKAQSGYIAKLAADRGFGFIALDTGEQIYFHASGLLSGLKIEELTLGDFVTFLILPTPKGKMAVRVKRYAETYNPTS